MINVLFVCLGNICRSPMAEAVLAQLIRESGLEDQVAVDSVGTGNWHVGQPAHSGTRAVLRREGIAYDGRARQVTNADLERADYIVAMDSANLVALREVDPALGARSVRLLDFAPAGSPADVPDPYHDGRFDYVYQLVDAGCRGFLAHIRSEHGI